jgi:adenosylmethionine-8-amino-7-oxononanoate aminotransferase
MPTTEAPPVVERAEGCTLFFSGGREVIDAGGGAVAVNIGHGRAEVAEAVAHATQRVSYVIPPWVTEERIALVEMLRERWLPPGLDRVGLVSGGSESVDSAIRLAINHFVSKGQPERWKVIGRETSYHGVTLASLAVGGHTSRRSGFEHVLTDHPKMPVADAEGLEKVIESEGADTIAAVIAEPVIGASAGAVLPPDDWWPDVRAICDTHGILLIFDEVICGFGRTGEWFGAQTFGVTPDLITFAKGVTSGYLPLSGVILSRSVCEELEEPGFLLRTGYTYSGHQASCAAGIANLEIMEREGLDQRANHVGERFQEGLRALQADGLIESWRGMGAVYAAELGRDSIPVRNEILANGVIVRPIGTCLAICPPLVITDDEVGRVIDTMAAALR